MRIVKNYIESRQQEFSTHPFFRWLEKARSRDEVAPLLPSFTFWVASFQDILMLNEERVKDPELRAIAKHHREEDAGHDQWFFSDLRRMGLAVPTARDLFGKEHVATRHASYALMAEVFRDMDDACRITLLLSLESTGHIFFEQTARWLERVGDPDQLKYFSRFHIDVEQKHELFEEDLDAKLNSLNLDVSVRAEAMAVVDRAYAAFIAMFDSFAEGLPEAARRKPQPIGNDASEVSSAS